MDRAALLSAFAEGFGRPCRVITRAPGRVNLIGEHTDYNEGFVLPIACQQSTRVACAGRDDSVACVISESIDARHEWALGRWHRDESPHWSGYVAGVAELLRERGAPISGFDMLIASDVPVGGGLSSSAALEVAAAKALACLAGHAIDDEQLAILCRRTEHEYAGVPCGIMDQTISILARADTALLLDCRNREFEHVPLSLGDKAVVVIDSRVRHELADGEYAQRQRQCADAVRFFQTLDPAVRSLRDVSVDALQAQESRMDPLTASRARHVVTENQRVLNAVAA
ncbi:MAG: galactokinase, partial [Planctomycetes bacterium]|nr:galactokinase [Planctomycetota bacterium]